MKVQLTDVSPTVVDEDTIVSDWHEEGVRRLIMKKMAISDKDESYFLPITIRLKI